MNNNNGNLLKTRCKQVRSLNESVLLDAKKLEDSIRIEKFHPFFYTGMAANQVGINRRMIALKLPFRRTEILVNPKIISSSVPLPTFDVCASLPGVIKMKKRDAFVILQYKDLKNSKKTKKLFLDAAFIIQHELDHLDGKLINDR